MSGKKVPHRITSASATSTRLLSRKNASRDSSESSRALERRSGSRAMISVADRIKTALMKTRNCTPMVEARTRGSIEDAAAHEECRADEHAIAQMAAFQTFSMPRFSCTMIECRNAVPTSQGISDAFSTGSQAQ